MFLKMIIVCTFLNVCTVYVIMAQDYDVKSPPGPPPAENDCNGIFVSYTFMSRTRVYPFIKNVSAQPWGFKSMATILNAGMHPLQSWKIFIGFQNREILVSASNAVSAEGAEFPAPVPNGTTLSGYPQADLKTAIETAGDLDQIQAQIELTGTQFGIKPPGYPMPRTIRLVNDGYKCPNPKRRGTNMHTCCVRDLKSKINDTTTRHYPRQKGDLLLSYDVLQAYGSNYLAQVTIENSNPLGRLDHWNLTWEWMRGEFIHTMRGAYARLKDTSECIYGPSGQFYKDLDFSSVMSCARKPVIGDLPVERAKDNDVGNLPYCCRNGTLLPSIMDDTKSISVFQLQVFKIPPDLSRTDLYPPQNWKIEGVINPKYKCGPVIRVDDAEFPDPNGLQSVSTAIASWQVVCNITRPKKHETRCCVSYSAYYNDSVIPCDTCACGCEKSKRCNPHAQALLLPSETLLIPFKHRTKKAVTWALMNHKRVPRPLPCPDNCGVSINWHVTSNHKGGWTARVTLFNWQENAFEDWFVAVQFNKPGFDRAYSFNGTLLRDLNDTVFLTGLPGLNYLMGETNGTNPDTDPRVPGKQQSVLTFKKKDIWGTDVVGGDGFPKRLLFNGEECALPSQYPKSKAWVHRVNPLLLAFVEFIVFWLLTCRISVLPT